MGGWVKHRADKRGKVAKSKHKYFLTSLERADKGLVIFNPAVGGWSRVEEGQKYLETCLRGVENFLYFF